MPQANHLIERIDYLLQKILGSEYEWVVVRSGVNLNEHNIKREKKALVMTRQINDSFEDGDHESIYKGLMVTHPAYGGTKWSINEVRKELG